MEFDPSEPLDNPKHERFAQLIVVGGKSQVEMYIESGYSENDGHAARLAGDGRIKSRVAWLQKQAAERAIVTLEGQTRKLLDLEAQCLIHSAHGDAVTERRLLKDTIMDTAKLNGLIVDKSKVDQTVKSTHDVILDIKPLSREDRAALNKMMEVEDGL